ncbi:MAG TPA: esterase-like activity of phytase family protein [Frankiaceae bacterium]|nr:esterase-like activity of phytase family protein [Frankiaceae bacterium]
MIDDVNATNATLAKGAVTPVPVAKDPYGYDSEGLVALPDGTFWVSDEYGPYITHFDANGFELGRLTSTGDANSEITALSSTQFLVDERDGNFEPFAQKTLYEVDINGATDVNGLTIGGLSPEAFVGTDGTNAALAALTGAGVHVAQKQPYVQVGALLSQLDPTGALFAHDKVEGVATTDAGKTLYLSNDDDFGIDSIVVDPSGAWTVHQKVLPPTGQTDNGEILKVDTTKLPAVLKTVTVTLHVH